MNGEAQSTRVYKPKEDAGITLPTVVREVKPGYTPEAMERKIQGSVWMLKRSCWRPATSAMCKSPGPWMPNTASIGRRLQASKQWKFKPGTKDGKPVAVEVTIEMTFTLK